VSAPRPPHEGPAEAAWSGGSALPRATRPTQLAADLVLLASRTSSLLPAGVNHADREPEAAFQVTLWRALAVFRVATLVYATVLTARNFPRYHYPYSAWIVIAVMAGWTLLAITAYAYPRRRTVPLLVTDVIITGCCVLSSRWIVGPELLGNNVPTLTITWMACPVLAVAIARPRWWGAVVAGIMGACDLSARAVLNQITITGSVIMVIAGIAVGHIAFLANQAQSRLRVAVEIEAVTRERERLARGIHDSVLQVLALVQRRGAELGGEAAELGRLAGEQEAALRVLISPAAVAAPTMSGLVDLRELINPYVVAGATLSAPVTGVWLRARVAQELTAAVAAAVENVGQHCPPDTRIWILVEDEPDAVTVTVRDDGPGIPAGRLAEAAWHGRLGVAQSISGRLDDLGGRASLTSSAGQGTEVELMVPRGGGPSR
jgi:signal transduction histidine kinase